MAASVRNETRAKMLAFAIEDLIFKMNVKMDNEYVLSIKALGTELAKPSTSEADVVKLSQAKPSDLEVFVSTLKKPIYFEL